MQDSAIRLQPGQAADLDALLADLRKLVQEKVVSDYEWYRRNAATPKRLFRFSGALVILLSVSIPLLAALEFRWNEVLLSVVALVIAALTGLNSFFKWESSWRGRRQTEFALAQLLTLYDLRIVEATHEPDKQRAKQIAIEATRELLERAQAAIGAETEEFFSRMVWPQAERR